MRKRQDKDLKNYSRQVHLENSIIGSRELQLLIGMSLT
jgi:hypothetical protein